ncbi:uncharacterized protein LOC108462057 [Gossypium arboreum]|uniref:uncharacterized protein LOC108462057 n=1 Tax=Gossypium arboreum TaxID=29729 RepID=UPI0022F14DCA|nr:uncharacterized protein LOC108462057 [Gossypium arboreum]
MQDQLQEQLAKMQNDMREQMLEAQKNMMAEMAQFLRATDKRKAPMAITGEDSEDSPPGFTPLHVPTHTEALLRRPSVTIRPHHEPVNTGVPMNFQTGLGFNVGDNSANPIIPDLYMVEKEDDVTEDLRAEAARQLDERCRWLGEKFKTLESAEGYHGINAKDLSLVPDLVLLHKFKMPEFEKYNGTTCPEAHITMFCRRMTGYVNNDQLLIHCFQDSLVGAAAKWQYAQRWREVAMQVQPPLLEKKTTMLFINTLKASFIIYMIGNTTKSFSDIVIAGEMIENAIRDGKIEVGETTKRSVPKKRENEVNSTSSYNKDHLRSITVNQPKVTTVGQQGSTKQESSVRQNFEKLQFTPIPMSYKELYQSLFDSHVVSSYYIRSLQPPYPKWYDSNAQCDYHAGVSGNSIENCTAFKKTVERLLEMGIVKFDDIPGTKSSLPNHGDKGVNAND